MRSYDHNTVYCIISHLVNQSRDRTNDPAAIDLVSLNLKLCQWVRVAVLTAEQFATRKDRCLLFLREKIRERKLWQIIPMTSRAQVLYDHDERELPRVRFGRVFFELTGSDGCTTQ
jgi:hypothetical protein